MGDERFYCPQCGPGIKAFEDGTCHDCGASIVTDDRLLSILAIGEAAVAARAAFHEWQDSPMSADYATGKVWSAADSQVEDMADTHLARWPEEGR